ncbi:MAG: hypothetical protein WCX65_20290 [bacterium]
MVIQCCACKRIKQADGKFVDGIVLASDANDISHGYCPYCEMLAEAAFNIAETTDCVDRLIEAVAHTCGEIRIARIYHFVPELTSDGFVLKFENGMEIGIERWHGAMFYHALVPGASHSGQIVWKVEVYATIYDYIVDLLLALPPK